MNLDKKAFKSIILIIAIAVLFLWIALNHETVLEVISYVIGIIMPLILGACMAFIFNVLMRAIETKVFIHISKRVDGNKKSGKMWNALKRPLSLILSLLLIFGIITVIVLLVIPELRNSIERLIEDVPDYINMVEGWIHQISSNFGIETDIEFSQLDWNEVLRQVGDFFSGEESDIFGAAAKVTSSVFSGVTTAVLGFVFSLYILLKKETLGKQTKSLIFAYLPRKSAKKILGVGRLSNEIFSNFIGGEFIIAIIMGIITFISLFVLGLFVGGMPFKLMISVLIGVSALIPIVGPIVATAIGFLLILIEDPFKALLFVIVIIIIQQFEGNIIYPKVVGKSIGLPGIWVLLAVTVGGSMYGVLGMIIAVPVFSVLYVLLKRSVKIRIGKKGLEEDDMTPKDLNKNIGSD